MLLPACENCGLSSSQLFCRDCFEVLKFRNACGHCGRTFTESGSPCLECRSRRWNWSELHSSFVFEGGVQSWIVDIKENGRPERWRELRREWIPRFRNQPEAIAYVPSDPHSFRRRLYDPGEYLALYLSKTLKLPVLKAFKREVFLRAQKQLHRQDRLYFFKETLGLEPLTQRFKCLLLVDDIMTTGASLDHCSGLLKGVSEQVVVYSVARTLATKPLI